MKHFLLSVFVFLSSFFQANAQVADGTIAPDFTVTDIMGNTHNLYSYLNANKHVILDFSATWCGKKESKEKILSKGQAQKFAPKT